MDRSFDIREIVPGSAEFDEAKILRYDTLYGAWGLPRSLAEDTDGRVYQQLAAFEDGRVIGFGRIHLEASESKIFQVCVAEDRRCRGVATAIMVELIDLAREAGRDLVVLDSRDTAVAFYQRLGFEPVGERFLSARTGTPHQGMRLVLR